MKNLSMIFVFLLIVSSCSVKRDNANSPSLPINRKVEISVDQIFGTQEIVELIGDKEVTSIEHNQKVEIGGMASAENLIVWSNPFEESKQEIYKINLGDVIEIKKIIKFYNNELLEIWFKVITPDSSEGWMYYGNNDPYENGCWNIIEKIKIDSKIFTVRKLEQGLSVFIDSTIYNYPSVVGTDIVAIIKLQENEYMRNVELLAITEETDTVDDHTFNWVKIVDSNGNVGWIFGNVLSAERGGPLFYTPFNTIDFSLGLEP